MVLFHIIIINNLIHYAIYVKNKINFMMIKPGMILYHIDIYYLQDILNQILYNKSKSLTHKEI